MKTKLFTILIVLVLGMAQLVKATPVNSNSIIKDGIEYYIQTDKSVYVLGEDVEMLFRVTNLRDEKVLIGCSQAPEFNLFVLKNNEMIWALNHIFKFYSPGIELLVGESVELSHIWDMIDDNDNLVDQGIYNVVGVMYNQPWNGDNHGNYIPTEVEVPITIIPEPTSLILLVFGSLILRHDFSLSKDGFLV